MFPYDPFGVRWMRSVYRTNHTGYVRGEVVSVRILECPQHVVFVALGKRTGRVYRTEGLERCYWDMFDLPLRSECIMSFLERVEGTGEGEMARRVVEDGEAERRFPAIYEYITAFKWPDGKPRITSTLTLMLDVDLFKLFLNDRENNRSACMTSDTILSVVELMEEVLSDGKAPWRPSDPPKRVNGRR